MFKRMSIVATIGIVMLVAWSVSWLVCCGNDENSPLPWIRFDVYRPLEVEKRLESSMEHNVEYQQLKELWKLRHKAPHRQTDN